MTRHGELIAVGQDLTLGYRHRRGPVEIVKHLDIGIRAGQMVCLLGPNGAGKSTLLRSLAGIVPVLSGRLAVGGLDPFRMRPGELARTMALVFNERPANGGIRVEELVSLGRLPHTGAFGRLEAKDLRAVDAALEATSATGLRQRSYSELSDGERARVQVARALAQDAPFLLMDEPTAHLDWPHRIALMRLLLALAREHGKAVLLSTHEIDLALQMADQWILLAPDCPPVCAAPEEIALLGAFDKAFPDAGFHLDPQHGQIRLDRRPFRALRLSGSGDACAWTARALERMGWRIDEAEGPLVEVLASGQDALWRIGEHGFDRLDALLHALARHRAEAAEPAQAKA